MWLLLCPLGFFLAVLGALWDESEECAMLFETTTVRSFERFVKDFEPRIHDAMATPSGRRRVETPLLRRWRSAGSIGSEFGRWTTRFGYLYAVGRD